MLELLTKVKRNRHEYASMQFIFLSLLAKVDPVMAVLFSIASDVQLGASKTVSQILNKQRSTMLMTACRGIGAIEAYRVTCLF
jgi:hypothetical protein